MTLRTLTFDPAQYKLMPHKPDVDTFVAGMEASVLGRPSVDDETYVSSIYSAMLAAVPDTLPGVVEHSGKPAEGESVLALALSDLHERQQANRQAWRICDAVAAALGDDLDHEAGSAASILRLKARVNPAPAQPVSAGLTDEQLKPVTDALQFYAEGSHFVIHDPNAWDTVSGEPQNYQEDESNTATVEDGSVAKQALAALLFAAQRDSQPVADTSADARDAARYRLLRRGQKWSVIDGIGETLRAEALDAAIDAAIAASREKP